MLDRIVQGNTPFKFNRNDNLIFSSKVIPVEENVQARQRMDSHLRKLGVIIHDNVHVSGHASSEELKEMIKMLKPKNLIPTHGNPSQEMPLVKSAEKMGYQFGKNVILSQDGKVLKL